ncbi:MAG TPA: DUF3558 domain-containing protein [Pseudonocardiaceae bacterium]|jgi:hypothetical protein|nr:DUF3558 domain-containing protein [Pseudonocardiaceae bacterium]
MRSVVNSRLVVLTMVALMGLAGCASATPGTGVAANTTTSSAEAPTDSASSSGLAAIKPCDLIDSSELSRLGLTSTGPTSGSGARSCGWDNNAYDNGLGYTIGADIRDGQGLNDINTNGFALSNDPIGHHQGKQVRETTGDVCGVTIGVTATSRVDISANTGSADINQACTLANQFAKLIEPNLP